MQIKPDIPVEDHESIASETESDTYLADQVLQRTNEANPEQERVVDLGDELLAMRAEVDTIAESLGLLASSAKALISDSPVLLENELHSLIQRKPLTALFGTTALSFLFTLRLVGPGKRRSN
ncbi:hypothetical protein [Phyllobacterium lublinensis]|uniref:hypothetical protein n=1 Tax=Phyllobacterium lublinensis TaxID=2875708 RepID=UPI001CCDA5F6|nr:hypothetical protein [Phyllobacterium sp. 2063]MBZ9657295.1 hypothetical protein [Phyllobacterium sp. 2063]